MLKKTLAQYSYTDRHVFILSLFSAICAVLISLLTFLFPCEFVYLGRSLFVVCTFIICCNSTIYYFQCGYLPIWAYVIVLLSFIRLLDPKLQWVSDHWDSFFFALLELKPLDLKSQNCYLLDLMMRITDDELYIIILSPSSFLFYFFVVCARVDVFKSNGLATFFDPQCRSKIWTPDLPLLKNINCFVSLVQPPKLNILLSSETEHSFIFLRFFFFFSLEIAVNSQSPLYMANWQL